MPRLACKPCDRFETELRCRLTVCPWVSCPPSLGFHTVRITKAKLKLCIQDARAQACSVSGQPCSSCTIPVAPQSPGSHRLAAKPPQTGLGSARAFTPLLNLSPKKPSVVAGSCVLTTNMALKRYSTTKVSMTPDLGGQCPAPSPFPGCSPGPRVRPHWWWRHWSGLVPCSPPHSPKFGPGSEFCFCHRSLEKVAPGMQSPSSRKRAGCSQALPAPCPAEAPLQEAPTLKEIGLEC